MKKKEGKNNCPRAYLFSNQDFLHKKVAAAFGNYAIRGGYAKAIAVGRHWEAVKHSWLLLLSQQPHPTALLLL